MTDYHLTLSGKTRFLNVFRRIFTIKPFESCLYFFIHRVGIRIFFKLVPPEYLYGVRSERKVKRGNLRYVLNLNHVVDHYIFWGFNDHIHDSVINTISSSKVILDIGANIGTTSLFYAQLNPNAIILSFEPHPETFKRAEVNLSLNEYPNVQLLNMGLGEAKSRLKLYEVNANNPGMNRIGLEDENLPFKWVEIDRLDQVLSDKNISSVDFIKMDVEGFELSVLKGGELMLRQCLPVLLIELDDSYLRQNKSSAEELVTWLINLGYSNIYRANNLDTITRSYNLKNCHFDIVAKKE